MKKIVITLSIVATFACNEKKTTIASEITSEKAQDTSMNNLKVDTNPSGIIDLEKLKFKTDVNTILASFGLSVKDNASDEYNLSGDYEEFRFKNPKIVFLGIEPNPEKTDLSLFYLKKDFPLFCYELETSDNESALKILENLEKKYKKPAFSKISGTKTGTIFLDENGEPKTDNIEEKIAVYEDVMAKQTFFAFHSVNYTSKPMEAKLTLIVLDKASKKYADWVSYRSLDMYYKK